MCDNWPWALAIEEKMVSTNVASERHEGSLVFLKYCIRDLNDLRTTSISKFAFHVYGLGFVLSSFSDGGLGFYSSASSM
jgi:hypothetical protein